jgi:hypothetical protein
MRRLAALAVMLAAASPAAAQELSFRPFVMVSEQKFVATKTFEAAFGQANQFLWGGGLNITSEDRYYLEVSASRFKKTGTRALFFDGQTFDLHIPQRVTITPLEITAGYRFHKWRTILPTVGAGVGLYRYKQDSDFSTGDENVDTQHAGLIAEGGVEVRVHRWVGIAADLHYTHVPGILGDAGFSKDAGEKDLGGLAGRFKVIIGK